MPTRRRLPLRRLPLALLLNAPGAEVLLVAAVPAAAGVLLIHALLVRLQTWLPTVLLLQATATWLLTVVLRRRLPLVLLPLPLRRLPPLLRAPGGEVLLVVGAEAAVRTAT